MAAQLCRRCGGEYAAHEDTCTFCSFPAAERSRVGKLFWAVCIVTVIGLCIGSAGALVYILRAPGTRPADVPPAPREPAPVVASRPAPKAPAPAAAPSTAVAPKPAPKPATPDQTFTSRTSTVGVAADLDLLDPAGTGRLKVEPVRRDDGLPR